MMNNKINKRESRREDASVNHDTDDTDIPEDQKVYRTTNVYLTSFLISQDFFNLGKVYMNTPNDKKAQMEVLYNSKYQDLLENMIDMYEKKKAVVNLTLYQNNIRFVMHLCNARKSGVR